MRVLTAFECPSSCIFRPGEIPTIPPVQGGVNFTGPGIVTCPVADYLVHPCEIGFVNDDFGICLTRNTECADFDNFPDINPVDAITNYSLPLACSCQLLLNCPTTCTFQSVDIAPSTDTAPVAAPTPTADRVPTPTAPVAPAASRNFTGPGIVTCPVADYLNQPCDANVDPNLCVTAADCRNEVGMFDPSNSLKNSTNATAFSFPLACSCVKFLGCPSSCTFQAASQGPPTAAAPSTSAAVARSWVVTTGVVWWMISGIVAVPL